MSRLLSHWEKSQTNCSDIFIIYIASHFAFWYDMAHKTPKLLKMPAHPCARTVAVFYFPIIFPTVQKHKNNRRIRRYGFKAPALWQSEPANRPTICKKNAKHWMCSHTFTFAGHFSCRKNDANELARGLYPLTPVNAKPKPIPLRKSELFCPKSNMPETANLKGSGIHER